MKDFRRFIVEAKRRGLRVITELVINHTSDQHDWFKRARRSEPKSSARNWYVWSDTDQKYLGTRIIFTDTEKSELDLGPRSRRVLLAPLLLAPAGSEFRQSARGQRRGAGHEALARYRRRRLPAGCDPLSVLSATAPTTRTCPRPTPSSRRSAPNSTPMPRARCCWPEANQWPEDVQEYFGQERRMPHGLSLPADAAHLHGDRAGGSLSDHRYPASDAGHPEQLPVGVVLCATTTS